jgi:hypothetical protein
MGQGFILDGKPVDEGILYYWSVVAISRHYVSGLKRASNSYLHRHSYFVPSRNESNLSHPSPLVIPKRSEGSAVRPAARIRISPSAMQV